MSLVKLMATKPFIALKNYLHQIFILQAHTHTHTLTNIYTHKHTEFTHLTLIADNNQFFGQTDWASHCYIYKVQNRPNNN